MTSSFVLIGALALGLTALVFAGMEVILWIMQVPDSLTGMMKDYLYAIFWGIPATFLYNYAASLLRGVGNSVVPLVFLAFSAVLNVALDLWFVLGFGWGIAGAAWATVISQYLSGLGLWGYTLWKYPWLLPRGEERRVTQKGIREIAGYSLLTCVQQSVMNFGILMVQGLVNSFGPTVMAAFAAAVKIGAFAYLPVQDFGNAFSIFIAQNFGAGERERIRKGIRAAVCSEPTTARLVKEHNNANMIAFGARIVGPEAAKSIIDAYLNAEFQGGRHAERVALIGAIEERECGADDRAV